MTFPPVVNLDHVEVTVEPWSWPFANAQSAEIDAHFAGLKRRQTALWNGRVLMFRSYVVNNDTLTATAFEADYASLCAWRDWEFPDSTVLHFFAPAAVYASDRAYVLGEMAPYTAGAGEITFPCGTPEPQDISGRSVDLMRHIRREITEETGLLADELECEAGWSFVRDRNYLALVKRFFSSQTADESRTRINIYLEAQAQPEFSKAWIVRGRADFNPRMAEFTLAFLEHECLHDRLSS
jgi:8-oxo-dGTP pyrophosphatase MutT (NUDIX family)